MRRDIRNSVFEFIAGQESATAARAPSVFVSRVVCADIGKAEILVGDFVSESVIESEFPSNGNRFSLAREVQISLREIREGVPFGPPRSADLWHGYWSALQLVECSQLRKGGCVDFKGYVRLGRNYMSLI